jgi:hypothetical protein
MIFVYDEELDNFIMFDKDQELEYLYYIINQYYNKYDFNSFEFNENLKESKKRKIEQEKKYNNKKYKYY